MKYVIYFPFERTLIVFLGSNDLCVSRPVQGTCKFKSNIDQHKSTIKIFINDKIVP